MHLLSLLIAPDFDMVILNGQKIYFEEDDDDYSHAGCRAASIAADLGQALGVEVRRVTVPPEVYAAEDRDYDDVLAWYKQQSNAAVVCRTTRPLFDGVAGNGEPILIPAGTRVRIASTNVSTTGIRLHDLVVLTEAGDDDPREVRYEGALDAFPTVS